MKNLQERVNEFAESEKSVKYAIRWSPSTYHFFYDAYVLGFCLDWVNRKLCECDYINLYTGLIEGLRREIKEGNYNWEDTAYLKKRLNDNKQKFFKELSNLIRDYCIGGIKYENCKYDKNSCNKRRVRHSKKGIYST